METRTLSTAFTTFSLVIAFLAINGVVRGQQVGGAGWFNGNPYRQIQYERIQPGPDRQTNWGAWSACVAGQKTRRRSSCNGNFGTCLQTVTCQDTRTTGIKENPWEQRIIIKPSNWGSWSGCTNGFRTRRKSPCTSGKGNFGCVQQERCQDLQVPWSPWGVKTVESSNWGSWSSCMGGLRRRRKSPCTSGKGQQGCVQQERCQDTQVPWSPWGVKTVESSNWGTWSSCMGGLRRRRKSPCTSGKGQQGCVQQERCQVTQSQWSPWTMRQQRGQVSKSLWSPWNPHTIKASNWGSWSSCVNGFRRRRKSPCTSGKGQQGCQQQERCQVTQPEWSPWGVKTVEPSNWGSWSSCVNGFRRRRKSPCTSGKGQQGCVQQERCQVTQPEWSAWVVKTVEPSNWGSWSSCVNGFRRRRKSPCTSGKGQQGCQQQERCQVTQPEWEPWGVRNVEPSNWGSWSSCVNGFRRRRKSPCTSGKGQYGCAQQERCQAIQSPWSPQRPDSRGQWRQEWW